MQCQDAIGQLVVINLKSTGNSMNILMYIHEYFNVVQLEENYLVSPHNWRQHRNGIPLFVGGLWTRWCLHPWLQLKRIRTNPKCFIVHKWRSLWFALAPWSNEQQMQKHIHISFNFTRFHKQTHYLSVGFIIWSALPAWIVRQPAKVNYARFLWKAAAMKYEKNMASGVSHCHVTLTDYSNDVSNDTFVHYNDVITSDMASQITSFGIVYSSVYLGENQRRYQSSASLAFVRGIHRWPVNSPHKGPVTRKVFLFDDLIMITMVLLTTMNRYCGSPSLSL